MIRTGEVSTVARLKKHSGGEVCGVNLRGSMAQKSTESLNRSDYAIVRQMLYFNREDS
jgi:hypothetical protein